MHVKSSMLRRGKVEATTATARSKKSAANSKAKAKGSAASANAWKDFDLDSLGGDTITLDAMTLAGVKDRRTFFEMIVDSIDQGLLGYSDPKKEPIYVFDGKDDESTGHFTIYSKGSTVTMLQVNNGIRAYLYNIMGQATAESERLRLQACAQTEDIYCGADEDEDEGHGDSSEDEYEEGVKGGILRNRIKKKKKQKNSSPSSSTTPMRRPAPGGEITIHNAEEFFEALKLRKTMILSHQRAIAAAAGAAGNALEDGEDDEENRDDDATNIVECNDFSENDNDCGDDESPTGISGDGCIPSASLSDVDPLEAILLTWQSRTKSHFGIAGLTKLDESVEATDMNISSSYFSGARITPDDGGGDDSYGAGVGRAGRAMNLRPICAPRFPDSNYLSYDVNDNGEDDDGVRDEEVQDSGGDDDGIDDEGTMDYKYSSKKKEEKPNRRPVKHDGD